MYSINQLMDDQWACAIGSLKSLELRPSSRGVCLDKKQMVATDVNVSATLQRVQARAVFRDWVTLIKAIRVGTRNTWSMVLDQLIRLFIGNSTLK